MKTLLILLAVLILSGCAALTPYEGSSERRHITPYHSHYSHYYGYGGYYGRRSHYSGYRRYRSHYGYYGRRSPHSGFRRHH